MSDQKESLEKYSQELSKVLMKNGLSSRDALDIANNMAFPIATLTDMAVSEIVVITLSQRKRDFGLKLTEKEIQKAARDCARIPRLVRLSYFNWRTAYHKESMKDSILFVFPFLNKIKKYGKYAFALVLLDLIIGLLLGGSVFSFLFHR